MTFVGWCLMLASVGFVVMLNAFCFYRVLKTPGAEDHLHAPLDIETREDLE
ncbi:MAG: hypothetical protein ACE5I7_08065 [Candidatus Binatia bacterium]